MTELPEGHDPDCGVDHARVDNLLETIAGAVNELHDAFGDGEISTGWVLLLSDQKMHESGPIIHGFDYIVSKDLSPLTASGLMHNCSLKLDKDIHGNTQLHG